MAYRVRSFSTMTVAQVNEVFLRGRGLGLQTERMPTSKDQDWFLEESASRPCGAAATYCGIKNYKGTKKFGFS